MITCVFVEHDKSAVAEDIQSVSQSVNELDTNTDLRYQLLLDIFSGLEDGEIDIFIGYVVKNLKYDLTSIEDLESIKKNKLSILNELYENGLLEPPTKLGTETHEDLFEYVFDNLDEGGYGYIQTFFNSFTSSTALSVKVIEPDTTEQDYAMAGHFYNPITEENKYNFPTPNAKDRFVTRYNNAVTYYRQGNYTSAIENLGYAIHYLEDMGTPCHTGERLDVEHGLTLNSFNFALVLTLYADELAGMGITHLAYEDYVKSNYNTSGWHASNFDDLLTYIDKSPENMAIYLSEQSEEYYTGMIFDLEGTAQNTIPMTERFVAALLIKFYFDANASDIISNDYNIKNLMCSRYFHIEDNSTALNAQIKLESTSFSSTYDKVYFYKRSGGYYNIKMVYSGRYLRISEGVNLFQYTNSSFTAQLFTYYRFRIVKLGNYYYIFSASSDYKEALQYNYFDYHVLDNTFIPILSNSWIILDV